MRKYFLNGLAMVLLSGLSVPALATVLVYTATLSGAQEVPPNASPGSGLSSIFLDTSTQMLTINVSFSGLGANVTAAHIHCCAGSGVNAGVALGLTAFPFASSGFYSKTFDLNLAGVLNGSFVTASGGTIPLAQAALLNGLEGGNAYVNLHTSALPGGEIRGQFAVSEPGVMGLLLFGVLAWRWRMTGA